MSAELRDTTLGGMKPEPMPENEEQNAEPEPKKPWPMSWVLIAILAYMLFQVVYILVKG